LFLLIKNNRKKEEPAPLEQAGDARPGIIPRHRIMPYKG
jgi:hypothetical protein